jgi:hypothetical protein
MKEDEEALSLADRSGLGRAGIEKFEPYRAELDWYRYIFASGRNAEPEI